MQALYPDVEVAVVARFDAQRRARACSSARAWSSRTSRASSSSEELADWSGGVLHTAFDGLPVAQPGGIDVVYDTIARPETLEVGVRVLAERGTLVQTGVSTPGR